MNRAGHVSIVSLGLALALYGTASLTGGWLGTPPWWDRVRRAQLVDLDELERSGAIRLSHEFPPSREHPSWIEPRPGREWISGAVIAVGAALMACGSAGSWREGRVCV